MRYFAILIFSTLLFSSCIKQEEEPIPSGCIGQSFSFVKPFSVNFPGMDIHSAAIDTLTATFSIPVDWKVSIEGVTSHAKYEAQGHSGSFTILWDGKSTNGSTFANQEEVKASLIVPCYEPIVKTIIMDNLRDYSSLGTLLADFEGNGTVQEQIRLGGYCGNNCWSSYFTPSMNTISKFEITSNPNALQGDHYLTIQSKAAETSWFGGGFYLFDLPAINNSPSGTYLNLMLNSGGKPNTTLAISFNYNGTDKYNYVLPLNWNGWKMVSIKFSDFKNNMGNSLTNLDANYSLDFGLNCGQAAGEELEVNLDLLIITKGNPLNQLFLTTN